MYPVFLVLLPLCAFPTSLLHFECGPHCVWCEYMYDVVNDMVPESVCIKSYSSIPEALLLNHELYKTFHIWFGPLQLAGQNEVHVIDMIAFSSIVFAMQKDTHLYCVNVSHLRIQE